MKLNCVFLIICLAIWTGETECAKILVIYPMPSPSHHIFIQPLLLKLAEKGHELTVVGPYPPKKEVKNFQYIMLEENVHVFDYLIGLLAEGKISTRFEEMRMWLITGQNFTRNLFDDSDFTELMRNPNGKFDLIIHDILGPYAVSGLGEYFNAPMIAVSPFGAGSINDDTVGNISPCSIIPNMAYPYLPPMSFLERLHNFWETFIDYIILDVVSFNLQNELYKKYFPNAKLSYKEATSSYSLLLVNQHHSLSFPRPYVTNVIEVGGLHIPQNPGPLPKDMQEFLDDAPHGVIYFSMGTNIKSRDLPVDKLKIIMKVFRELKQKILWKFEDANLPNKPDNVFISPWCPQHAILNHPNIKVFITHGGLLSTTESIFYGKPMLGIPMFAEQPRNVGIAVKRGIALKVDFKTLTADDLKHALEELLYNPKYKTKIAEISQQFHDKPLSAMETAEFWVEYVLRHKGAKFLQSASTQLNFLQFYSIDVMAVILTVVLSLILMLVWVIKKLFKTLVRSAPSKKPKVKKN